MKGNLGKFLRKLRVDEDEYLKDMSERIGVSISFLSAVENETKKITPKMIDKLVEEYSLNSGQEDQLRKYAMEANNEVDIDLSKLNENGIDLTYRFARNVTNLSDNDIELIRSILRRADKK
jgi:transcriptional regulator with XRE-family HTH domain